MPLPTESIQNFVESKGEIGRRIHILAESLMKEVTKLDEEQKKIVEKCLEFDWYPIWPIALTSVPDDCDFNIYMADFIEAHLDDIEENLCEGYTNRAHILKAAFDAHRQEVYALSTPIFLIQAEGICVESDLKVSPYTKNKGKRILEDEVKDKIPHHPFTEFLLKHFQPAIINEKIAKDSKNAGPSQLNRHAILHGTSTEYGTRENSLKAVSFLSSLSFLLIAVRASNQV